MAEALWTNIHGMYVTQLYNIVRTHHQVESSLNSTLYVHSVYESNERPLWLDPVLRVNFAPY